MLDYKSRTGDQRNRSVDGVGVANRALEKQVPKGLEPVTFFGVRLSRGTSGGASLGSSRSSGSGIGQSRGFSGRANRGLRPARFRVPDGLYLLYIRENVSSIERALPRLTNYAAVAEAVITNRN
jgi:hypothetical protein